MPKKVFRVEKIVDSSSRDHGRRAQRRGVERRYCKGVENWFNFSNHDVYVVHECNKRS
jgi:hypothetical protein